MDLKSRWPILNRLCELAAELDGIEIWVFGSMLRSDEPNDLDVLVLYGNREDVIALRAEELWEVRVPPVDIIAMTPSEQEHYDFISITGAVRLHPPQ
ncbi:nucleotidyltransferase domain-containing protein [Mycobacterium marinum]|uniref:nucleotidyltransferase domain-containing protein n=1 Tax=Mycobacterium marinum TaxID=1781 RepID=UPI002340CF87|nr:nucleotidyltransferase domain-containing protein [Mycobacterium marinum]MDC8993690.1 nucleotidyltransferase domain-containing protein [Mycobacterium marinum]WDZ14569.1 nucleotidyltransferase domain-containing protein [Mycobacterium marinum]